MSCCGDEGMDRHLAISPPELCMVQQQHGMGYVTARPKLQSV